MEAKAAAELEAEDEESAAQRAKEAAEAGEEESWGPGWSEERHEWVHVDDVELELGKKSSATSSLISASKSEEEERAEQKRKEAEERKYVSRKISLVQLGRMAVGVVPPHFWAGQSGEGAG